MGTESKGKEYFSKLSKIEFETASAFFIFIVLSVFFKLIFSNFCVLMGDIVIFYSLIYNVYILGIC